MHYNGMHSRITAGAAISIQTQLARGPAARARAAMIALRAFKKYAVDDDEMHQYSIPCSELNHDSSTSCYWAYVGLESESSRSRPIRKMTHTRVAWVKPKLLRNADVQKILRRPSVRTAFIVDCAFCGIRAAEKVCLDSCADPFFNA